MPLIRPRPRSTTRRGRTRSSCGSATPPARASTPAARVRIRRKSTHSSHPSLAADANLGSPSEPHQFRTRINRIEAQRTRSKSNKSAGKSTNPIDILPLITVWLQVQDRSYRGNCYSAAPVSAPDWSFVTRQPSASHTRQRGTARPPSDSYSTLTESPHAHRCSFSRLLFRARYRRVDGARGRK